MNIRCAFCQTPYAIGRIEKLDALQHMYANNLNHYDAHCPRCRRATPVQRQRLEMTLPNWREALKELEKEMAANPQQAAPPPPSKPEPFGQTQGKPDSAPEAESKPAQAPAKDTPAKEKPAARKPAAQKPAAQKPATAKKAAAKKSK